MTGNCPNNRLYQFQEVLSVLKKAGSALLFCHVSPDGDTLGSALALAIRMQRMGWKVRMAVDGTVPDNLKFLPEIDRFLVQADQVEPFETAIAVDVSSHERLRSLEALYDKAPFRVLIDHHETNPGFGQLNMVDGQCPATAVLIYRLLCEMGPALSEQEAVCLYTGLSTDTGNFIYDSVTPECFHMMAALREVVPFEPYARMLFREKEAAFVRLLSKVLPTLTLFCDGHAAGITLPYACMLEAGATEGHTDCLVDYAIDIKGVELAYFIRETKDGAVKVSLRAKEGYSVNDVATSFGGGGHSQAAGITMHSTLEECVSQIREALTRKYESTQK